jgi:hypothetical protein
MKIRSAVPYLLHAYRPTAGQSGFNRRSAEMRTCLKISLTVFWVGSCVVLQVGLPVITVLLLRRGTTVCMELQPPMGPLSIPKMDMEQRWNDTGRGKSKDSERNLSQSHFVHHKSHMDCPGRDPGPPQRESGDKPLRYGPYRWFPLARQNDTTQKS